VNILFKILFFLGIFVLFLHPIDSDGDFFQHVNIGRSIISEKGFPRYDAFTHTAAGSTYIGYSWGTGVIFYLLYKYTGSIGVNLFVASVAMLTFFLLFHLAKIISKSEKGAFLTIALSAPIIATRFPSRPEIITYPFVLALLLINELKEKYPRIVLLFPIIILFWANMYSVSILVGLGLLLIFAIKKYQQKLFYLSVLTCFPMALLNGYGTSAVFYFLRIGELAEFHGDWAGIGKILSTAPTEYLLIYQYTLLLFFLYVGFLILAAIISFKMVRSHLLFLFLSFGLFVPFLAARQMPLAVLLSTPLLAVLLSPSLRWHKQLVNFGIAVAAISLLLLIKTNPPGTGEDLETFPPSMVTFIKESKLEGNVFNTQRIGSFLSYHLYPQIKVFSDSRDDLFVNTTVLQEMGRIIYSQKRMAQLLDSYKVDIVIVDLTEGGSYPFLLKSGWVPVYKDSLYLILVPIETAQEKGLKSVKWI